MGVAPHRSTESVIRDAAKAGLNEDEASANGAGAATTVEDFGAEDRGVEESAAEDPAAEHQAVEDPAVEDRAVGDAADETSPAPVPARRASGPRGRGTRRLAAPPMARRPMLILCTAFSVLVVVLAAIAIKLGLGLAADQRQQNDQQAALHAARQAAADLMTISYQSAGSDINRILSVATGTFRAQVAGSRQQVMKATVNAQAVSKANVLGAGLVGGQVTGNTATVVVVVDSTVTSKNAPNGVVNHYRETITLNKTGGRWLASQLDFATPGGGQ